MRGNYTLRRTAAHSVNASAMIARTASITRALHPLLPARVASLSMRLETLPSIFARSLTISAGVGAAAAAVSGARKTTKTTKASKPASAAGTKPKARKTKAAKKAPAAKKALKPKLKAWEALGPDGTKCEL